MLQPAELVSLLDHDVNDVVGLARQFDTWCLEQVRPWFEEQVEEDAALLARFSGDSLDVDSRIPSGVISAALEADPVLGPAVGAYLAMLPPPKTLRAVEERVRELLRRGWRPGFAEGPSRDELVELIDSAEPCATPV